jgi:hypothetical protein
MGLFIASQPDVDRCTGWGPITAIIRMILFEWHLERSCCLSTGNSAHTSPTTAWDMTFGLAADRNHQYSFDVVQISSMR